MANALKKPNLPFDDLSLLYMYLKYQDPNHYSEKAQVFDRILDGYVSRFSPTQREGVRKAILNQVKELSNRALDQVLALTYGSTLITPDMWHYAYYSDAMKNPYIALSAFMDALSSSEKKRMVFNMLTDPYSREHVLDLVDHEVLPLEKPNVLLKSEKEQQIRQIGHMIVDHGGATHKPYLFAQLIQDIQANQNITTKIDEAYLKTYIQSSKYLKDLVTEQSDQLLDGILGEVRSSLSDFIFDQRGALGWNDLITVIQAYIQDDFNLTYTKNQVDSLLLQLGYINEKGLPSYFITQPLTLADLKVIANQYLNDRSVSTIRTEELFKDNSGNPIEFAVFVDDPMDPTQEIGYGFDPYSGVLTGVRASPKPAFQPQTSFDEISKQSGFSQVENFLNQSNIQGNRDYTVVDNLMIVTVTKQPMVGSIGGQTTVDIYHFDKDTGDILGVPQVQSLAARAIDEQLKAKVQAASQVPTGIPVMAFRAEQWPVKLHEIGRHIGSQLIEYLDEQEEKAKKQHQLLDRNTLLKGVNSLVAEYLQDRRVEAVQKTEKLQEMQNKTREEKAREITELNQQFDAQITNTKLDLEDLRMLLRMLGVWPEKLGTLGKEVRQEIQEYVLDKVGGEIYTNLSQGEQRNLLNGINMILELGLEPQKREDLTRARTPEAKQNVEDEFKRKFEAIKLNQADLKELIEAIQH
jgi:hypothetical protein